MNLTKKEIEKILYCLILIMQNYGETDELHSIYDKLILYLEGLKDDKD